MPPRRNTCMFFGNSTACIHCSKLSRTNAALIEPLDLCSPSHVTVGEINCVWMVRAGNECYYRGKVVVATESRSFFLKVKGPSANFSPWQNVGWSGCRKQVFLLDGLTVNPAQLLYCYCCCSLSVLGFSPSEFIGQERGEAHSVQAGYLSGRPDMGGLLTVELSVGTASEYLSSLPPSLPTIQISFILL